MSFLKRVRKSFIGKSISAQWKLLTYPSHLASQKTGGRLPDTWTPEGRTQWAIVAPTMVNPVTAGLAVSAMAIRNHDAKRDAERARRGPVLNALDDAADGLGVKTSTLLLAGGVAALAAAAWSNS